MNRIVLITGCSSGFGKACAEKFASNGDHLIITGRRRDNLEALKQKLKAEYNIRVQVLVFDVQNNQQVTEAILSLDNSWQQVDILINNAGLALGRDFFEEASIDDWEIMIDTNVKGVMYVTKAVLPLMVPRRSGHIVNIGSVSGKEVYEKGNAYCASKFAVDALTKAMRTDLLRHRIKVTGIHPGAAETEFSNVRFKGDDTLAAQIYEGYKPLTAEDVADVVLYCCSLPDHVCINDLVMTCTSQANAYYTYRE